MEVAAHPEWLALPGQTVAVLGAGAEMGPLTALMRWGATVAAVDLPVPAVWERVVKTAEDGAGRLIVPVRPDADAAPAGSPVPPASICWPRSRRWLTGWDRSTAG